MTEKTEIREDAQENGLVLCVCKAELLLLTVLFRNLFFFFQASFIPHTHKNSHADAREHACMITHMHAHSLPPASTPTHTAPQMIIGLGKGPFHISSCINQ